MIKNILEYNNNNMVAWYEYLTAMNKIDKLASENNNLYEDTHKDIIKMNEYAMDGIIDSMSKQAQKINNWVDEFMWEWYY